MKDKKFKCWTKIRKILNKYGYSYMDMVGYLHLIDISRIWREFEAHIFEIKKIKPKNLKKNIKIEKRFKLWKEKGWWVLRIKGNADIFTSKDRKELIKVLEKVK